MCVCVCVCEREREREEEEEEGVCLVWDSTMNMYKKQQPGKIIYRQLSKTMYAERKKFGETRRHRRSLLLCKGGGGVLFFHAGRLFPSRRTGRSVGRTRVFLLSVFLRAGRGSKSGQRLLSWRVH